MLRPAGPLRTSLQSSGCGIEGTEANALAHLFEFEFDVPYLSLFDPFNELAGRFRGIDARTIPSTVFVDPEGRVAARLIGLTHAREVGALAGRVLDSLCRLTYRRRHGGAN